MKLHTTLLAYTSAVISACGTPESGVICDVYVWGTCVTNKTNLFLNLEVLDKALGATEEGIQKRYGADFDLDSYLSERGTSITFVYEDDFTAKTYGVDALVNLDEDSCYNTYFYAAHEILHVFSVGYLDYSMEEDRKHEIPGVFRDDDFGISIDLDVALNIRFICAQR